MSIEQYAFDEGSVDLAKLNILKATNMTLAFGIPPNTFVFDRYLQLMIIIIH